MSLENYSGMTDPPAAPESIQGMIKCNCSSDLPGQDALFANVA